MNTRQIGPTVDAHPAAARLSWVSEDEEAYFAQQVLGRHGSLHLVVERLGEAQWDWHVWDATGRLRPHFGMTDSLDQAKDLAWRAVMRLDWQSSTAK